MGACTEKLCSELGITREAQDEFAIKSYKLAREAQEKGLFTNQIVRISETDKKGKEVMIDKDEEC